MLSTSPVVDCVSYHEWAELFNCNHRVTPVSGCRPQNTPTCCLSHPGSLTLPNLPEVHGTDVQGAGSFRLSRESIGMPASERSYGSLPATRKTPVPSLKRRSWCRVLQCCSVAGGDSTHFFSALPAQHGRVRRTTKLKLTEFRPQRPAIRSPGVRQDAAGPFAPPRSSPA